MKTLQTEIRFNATGMLEYSLDNFFPEISSPAQKKNSQTCKVVYVN